jgi:hypothetical protein
MEPGDVHGRALDMADVLLATAILPPLPQADFPARYASNGVYLWLLHLQWVLLVFYLDPTRSGMVYGLLQHVLDELILPLINFLILKISNVGFDHK